MEYAVIDVFENTWLYETDDVEEGYDFVRKCHADGLPVVMVKIIVGEDEDPPPNIF